MKKESTFLCKTIGNASPEGKPRVYFTCHPADFEKHFEKVCHDIFQTQDCAFYYTADMTEPIENENNLTDLERMNLFVIPVTLRLLREENRALDHDLRFAETAYRARRYQGHILVAEADTKEEKIDRHFY